MDLNDTIFVSDFDGTLLTTDKRISNVNIDAINEYQRLGGKFTIATGRPIQTVEQYIDCINYNLPMILCNGAVIYDPYAKAVLWAKYLPNNVSDIVKDITITFPTIATEVYTIDAQHYLRMNDTEKWHQSLLGFNFVKVDSFDDISKPVCKLLFADDESVIDELCKYVNKFSGVHFVRSLSKFLEVLPLDISKAYAVKKLQELTDTENHKVFTAGDYDNDIEMLKASDISFCPANSEDCVKQATTVVLNSTNDDGVMKEALSYLISK